MLTIKTAVYVNRGTSRIVNMRLKKIVLNVATINILLARLLTENSLKKSYTELGVRPNKTAEILLDFKL